MPPPSWPRIAGNKPSGSAPDIVYASVWHTPVATIRTSTSPALGPPISISSMLNGLQASQATAARVFMTTPCLCVQRGCVMTQVILDERCDKEIVVTVAGTHAQVQRLARLLARRFEQVRAQATEMRV